MKKHRYNQTAGHLKGRLQLEAVLNRLSKCVARSKTNMNYGAANLHTLGAVDDWRSRVTLSFLGMYVSAS